ncbi:glycosyltransferase family 4 protein, partial [Methylobacterium sp. Leaf118]|uniref:glycosyltransferase family 4 protein n=1 Tax=Methylobacterium sp. Leaf118 TaxID=2876562 RepID=UPI003FA52E63
MADAPAILVLAPMPAAPASAGNRRRLVATCETLMRGGFSVDLAYYAHEDQIYRRFGQHPPTDLAAMADRVRNLFLIEAHAVIPLKTRAPCFGIDEWCPDEVGDFVAWYVAQFPDTRAVLANYIFLSRALERVPSGVLRLIDTHDRFSGRQTQYRPFRAEPNFFYTDDAGEAAGLARADIVLAIQAGEARAFAGLAAAEVLLLPPVFPAERAFLPAERAFAPPERVARIGFLGHGNDPNLFSIGRFAQAWGQGWTPDRPELVIAGEICRSLEGIDGPGVRRLGYLDRLSDFYDQADLVVAPMLMGSGLKMKVGEALSYGRAVIGTEIGLEGFEPEHPAHRCRDVEAVKAAVLAVVADREALTGLTRASEALFVRYAAVAAAAEARLIARLQAQTPPAARVEGGPAAAPQAAPAVARVTASGGGLVLTAEHSARSLPAADPDLGVLVATERRPGDGTAASYRPERRRWFGRA